MELREYLFRYRISTSEFARRLGYSKAYMYRIVNRCLLPGKKIAVKIVDLTKGEVSFEDLYYEKPALPFYQKKKTQPE